MKREWTPIGDYLVEIWFFIEKDMDGYPKSKKWEQLLAQPLAEKDDSFRLVSIPFYLKNVSRGDVVRARVTRNTEISNQEIFEFDEVLDRAEHNTYRILLKNKHPGDPLFTQKELLSKGLAIEEQHGDFLAIDAPPSVDQQAIDAYLIAEARSGRWELQDGFLSTIKKT